MYFGLYIGWGCAFVFIFVGDVPWFVYWLGVYFYQLNKGICISAVKSCFQELKVHV